MYCNPHLGMRYVQPTLGHALCATHTWTCAMCNPHIHVHYAYPALMCVLLVKIEFYFFICVCVCIHWCAALQLTD